MKLRSIILLLVLASCNTKYSIKGSWYTDSKDGRGERDSVSHYVEVYVNESIIRFHEEMMGQLYDQKYYVKGDSVYKCFGTDKDCDFIAMYKITRLRKDTIWMTVNPDYTNQDGEIFWVRLPQNELGPFDLTWTPANKDSLNEKVLMDWNRRREKYFAIKQNRLEYYDSLVKAGTWKWTMKELREWEKANKPSTLTNKYTVDDLPLSIPDSLRELLGDTTMKSK